MLRFPGTLRPCASEERQQHSDVACLLSRNVLYRPEDPGALDVEDGVPPPRAAPALLRRVVLSSAATL